MRDLIQVIKNLKFLPTTLKSNPYDAEIHDVLMRGVQQKNPPKNTFSHSIERIINFDRFKNTIIYPAHEKPVHEKYSFFYINGIMAQTNKTFKHVNLLTVLCKHPVLGLYNPTNGIIFDSLEAIFGRTFNVREQMCKFACEEIIKEIIKGKDVILIGHSQGGIIVSNVLKRLHKRDPELLNHVEVYTIASGADEMRACKYAEHFANEFDIVSNIGVLANERTTFGTIYVGHRCGHSLDYNYLTGILNYEYNNRNSRFTKILNGNI